MKTITKEEYQEIEYLLRQKIYDMTEELAELNDRAIDFVDEKKIPDEYYYAIEEQAMETLQLLKEYQELINKIRQKT